MTQSSDQLPAADPGTDAQEPEAETAGSAEVAEHSAPEDSAPQDSAPEDSAAGDSRAPSRRDRLESEGDIAADFLEELLDIADLDGDIDMDVDGNRAAVSIVGAELTELVGADGEVLEALQELTRLAVLRETGERSRLMLDVAGFRQRRRAELVVLAAAAIAQVQEKAEPVKLAPMSPFERKVVHDAVADAGLQSESEGVEPRRCVVVLPAD